jgi:hypothetical protein
MTGRFHLVDLIEWPATRPLTRWSNMVRFYWWLSVLLPPVALLAAIDTARTARVADEAMGLGFFLAPYLLAALAVAPFLAYRAWISKAITPAERRILIALGLSAVPLVILVAQICDDFGGWPRGQEHPTRALTGALTVAWVGLAIAARRTLHRDIPPRWHQLWWLLVPLPPVSFFIALVNLIPSKPTDDRSPYPMWPFLIGATLLLPLVAYRALFSPAATRSYRIAIVLTSLSVLPFFLLVCAAWHFAGTMPSGAGPAAWALFLGLSAGWVALAVATRLRLRGRSKAG